EQRPENLLEAVGIGDDEVRDASYLELERSTSAQGVPRALDDRLDPEDLLGWLQRTDLETRRDEELGHHAAKPICLVRDGLQVGPGSLRQLGLLANLGGEGTHPGEGRLQVVSHAPEEVALDRRHPVQLL